jgi:hypothetical protein
MNLPQERVDLKGSNDLVTVAVDSLEGSEGLEVWDAGEQLSLTFNGELGFSYGLEKFFQFVLGFNT